ncbi:MAG: hypothetical protein PHX78_10875 [bacterium]|nr:hypothetical protein [bacterium]
MKKIFILFVLFLQVLAVPPVAITPLELRLREIRDDYRHSPYDGAKKIENLWDDFPGINDRIRIFLDLNHYYQKHSLDKLLLKQGKWLLKKNIPSEKSRIWIIIPVAETLAKQKDFKEAVIYYDKAFASGCVLSGKDPKFLSREDFIKNGMNGISLWDETAVSASLNYARAGKFDDAYAILSFTKSITSDGRITSGSTDIKYERIKIQIMALMQKKSKDALKKLKLINEGKPYLTIEPETMRTAEEELCLQEKDYGLLANIYLNTLIINPPCDQLTYKRITYNARSTVYVLGKLLELFKNEDFCVVFEKAIKEKLKGSNLPHIDLLLAEYYSYRKNNKQAGFYYKEVIKLGRNQIYRWPKYYPDLNLNGNYRSPHRPHLWQTCYERASTAEF